jgi:glucokinase
MYERPATKNDLKAVRQNKGETLRQYIQRFSQMRNKIPRISNEEVISAFSTGISDVYARICSCRQCWASKCRGL